MVIPSSVPSILAGYRCSCLYIYPCVEIYNTLSTANTNTSYLLHNIHCRDITCTDHTSSTESVHSAVSAMTRSPQHTDCTAAAGSPWLCTVYSTVQTIVYSTVQNRSAITAPAYTLVNQTHRHYKNFEFKT